MTNKKPGVLATIDRRKVEKLLSEERAGYAEKHPKSRVLFDQAKGSLLGGVPMTWMTKWPGQFPVFVERASGAHLTDVDGLDYIDFCLGDTGAMAGHAPAASVRAATQQLQQGTSFMLPTADCIDVGKELASRFGLPYWQIVLTATDANRFAIRLARQITGRSKILVFNYCYHGTVDETFITLKDGVATSRSGNIGAPVDPVVTTRVVEFNDIPALKEALSHGDVACVLAEPVMTNIGIIHPDPGFHEALRELTKAAGTLLIIDETHTICAGPGGYTKANNLKPDILTVGKPLAGGIPAAAYGLSAGVAQKIQSHANIQDCDTGGIGGTLAGNALSVAAMKATLSEVLTEETYKHTFRLAEKFSSEVENVIEEMQLPWIVKRLGCRVEYWFSKTAPRNGGEAAAAIDFDLDQYMHLAALNRGILMTPFHNMALIAPTTTEADIDKHTQVFAEIAKQLV